MTTTQTPILARIVTDRFGGAKWRGHLDVNAPKIRGKYRTIYEFLGKSAGRGYREDVSEVQVCQQPKGWVLRLYGDDLETFETKMEAQRAAESLVGLR